MDDLDQKFSSPGGQCGGELRAAVWFYHLIFQSMMSPSGMTMTRYTGGLTFHPDATDQQ